MASAWITRSCGFFCWPLRSFHSVVTEISSPVTLWIMKQTSALDRGPRPAGCACSMSQLTLSAKVRRAGLPSPPGPA